ncbi:MAG TPA: LysR family transcriptional regulator [Acidimicrobiales bacterium]
MLDHQVRVRPLRARGGASHNTALHPVIDPDTCPSHLLAAFQGQGAIERVRRFIVIADQPTITRAAATPGTTQSVLTSQIARLEADLGQQLIERAQPNRPCQLTPAGRDFLHHACSVLGRMDQEPTAQAG